MHRSTLTPIELAALYMLLKRRPLFNWERNALTDGTTRSLEEKGLIAREGDQWRVTAKVIPGSTPRLR